MEQRQLTATDGGTAPLFVGVRAVVVRTGGAVEQWMARMADSPATMPCYGATREEAVEELRRQVAGMLAGDVDPLAVVVEVVQSGTAARREPDAAVLDLGNVKTEGE